MQQYQRKHIDAVQTCHLNGTAPGAPEEVLWGLSAVEVCI